MKFEWYEAKRQSNVDKHAFDFVDILPGFEHVDRLIFEDSRRDYGEGRFILFAPIEGAFVLCSLYNTRRCYSPHLGEKM